MALATLMAVPLGILGAIYLNEYGGRNFLARLIRFFSDVMTGVPSIIMGLFIFSIWVLRFGFSGFPGALALGCLMLPVVIRSTDEMLKLVPNALREGSYALGATKARVTVTMVLPAAIGGIVSGALLAVARAAGETAPLLFTILTVTTVNKNVFSGATPRCPRRSSRTRTRRIPARRTAAGARRSRSSSWPSSFWPSPASSPHGSPDIRARNVPPESSARNAMDQPEQNIVTDTELPKSEVRITPGASELDAPGATVFDAKKVSCYYGSFRAVTDVCCPSTSTRSRRSSARPGAARRRCCGH